MKADYAVEPALYEECLTLMESCFPGIKAIADQGRLHNAYWDKSSTPFIVRHENELIAHLGILPFDFIIQGKPYRGAAIHGVCTKEAFRRKGYFKTLMLEALSYIRQHYDFSFLFTDQPYLYELFGFKALTEYDFVYNFQDTDLKPTLRKLNLDHSDDLQLMQDLYLHRLPISNCFGIVKETTVATLNAMHQPVYYIEAINALIVYQAIDECLYIKDIVTKKRCDLDLIVSAIPEKFTKVVLQFSPDNFMQLPFNPMVATPECCIMISEEFEITCPSFRYPEPQRC